jgi:hypothetical protein
MRAPFGRLNKSLSHGRSELAPTPRLVQKKASSVGVERFVDVPDVGESHFEAESPSDAHCHAMRSD